MKLPRWIYSLRGFLVTPPIIVSLILTKGTVFPGYMNWVAGVVICTLGLLVRVWGVQHLKFRLKGRMDLAKTGPYQYIRNPLYIGNGLLCLGAVACSGILCLLPVTLIWSILVYNLVATYEEGRLVEKYGDEYLEFKKKIPRYFPRTLKFKNLKFINENFKETLFLELRVYLVLLPFIIKELILYFLI